MQVYLSLCCALVASALGAYLHILWNIGGLLTTIGCMGSIVWLLSTPPYKEVLSLLHLSSIVLVLLVCYISKIFHSFLILKLLFLYVCFWTAKEGFTFDDRCSSWRGLHWPSDWVGHWFWPKVYHICLYFDISYF